jgi:hypothetical protein
MRARRARGLDTYASLSPEQRQRAIARAYLRSYVARGRIVKPSRCQGCGKRRQLDAHHDDYTKPLAVRWLCARRYRQSCHRAADEV